jgi:hypothetical protein
MTEESIHACIAAGLACMREVKRCVDACESHPESGTCERACRKCFDACVLWLADLHACDSPRLSSRLACAYACELCADACDQHEAAIFRECVAACRRCAEACRKSAARSNARGWETILPDLLD